jgi:hypothetical protein
VSLIKQQFLCPDTMTLETKVENKIDMVVNCSQSPVPNSASFTGRIMYGPAFEKKETNALHYFI